MVVVVVVVGVVTNSGGGTGKAEAHVRLAHVSYTEHPQHVNGLPQQKRQRAPSLTRSPSTR